MTLLVDERSSERSLADTVWHGRSIAAGSFISTAAPFWELVVTDNGCTEPTATLRGPETCPARLDYAENGAWWGIRFPIGTHLAGISLASLVDSSISWPVSVSGTVIICGATCHIKDHASADALVHRLAELGMLVHDPEVAAVWRGATANIPPRTLQRRFRAATGLSQQTARQIQRARVALDLLRAGTTILDTVAQLGYSDQAHLTRSLTRWIGQTPAQVVQQSRAATLA